MPTAISTRRKGQGLNSFKMGNQFPNVQKSTLNGDLIEYQCMLREDLEEVKNQLILAKKQRTKYSNTQQYNQAILISVKITELRRKQQEKQSELSSLLAKEAKALKYKSKSEAKVKEQPTTKSLPARKSGSIPNLFKAQQQKREKESTRRAEGNDDDEMTVQTGESKQGEQVRAGICSEGCSEKNVENDLSQASSKKDISKPSQGTVAHVNGEEVCKGLQVPAVTVSNECLEKRTEILPCLSISQQGISRGDPGTAKA